METFAPFPVDFITDDTLLNEDDPYLSLQQFDFELQQQAQVALQQESWQDFDKYLSLENNIFNPPLLDNTTFNDPSLLYAPLEIPVKKDDEWPNHVKHEYGTPESIYSPLLQQEAKNVNTNQSPKLAHSTPTLSWSTEQQGKVPIQRLKQINTVNNAVNAVLNNTSLPTGRQHKKTAHNAIERRYRNNINDRITELKNAVPALLYAKVKDNRKRPHKNDEEDDGEDGEEYLDGVAVATKLNKATILRKATEYINHLKKMGQDIKRENEILQKILTQMPGGPDILQQYHVQKQQREQEMQRQQLLDREIQRQQEQQRKIANRKRARYNKTQEDEDESSSSSDPATPPSSNRVFMAMFMAITFFSTTPISQNHTHASKEVAKESYSLLSLFQLDSTWSIVRTCVILFFITQWIYPILRSHLFGSTLTLKRVNRVMHKELTMTPGDERCQKMYILNRRLLPQHLISTLFGILKETVRLCTHHFLGYDILYEDDETEVIEWIKLNEMLCLGLVPASRLTLIYTALAMINSVHVQDQDHVRAYTTAAMQFSLAIPTLADRISDYLLRRVSMEEFSERAWSETLEVLQSQRQSTDEGLSLSYTAPVLVPLQILSTLHWLDCLKTQFQWLVALLTDEEEDKTEFEPILNSTQGLTHWMAIVGLLVEGLWKDQIEQAEAWLDTLARAPRSVTGCHSQRKESNRLDELTKKAIVHTLVGAVYLKTEGKESLGLAELNLAEDLRVEIHAVQVKRRFDLESTVLSLADFMVSFVGLDAWLTAIERSTEDTAQMEERVKAIVLSLRRMLRHPYLKSMVGTKDILERLTEINHFLEHSAGDTDSACDLGEEEGKRAKRAQAILHGLKE